MTNRSKDRRRFAGLRILGVLAILLAAPASGTTTEGGPSERTKHISLAGQFLVASPDMGDPRFVETVIFMVRHDRSGAMGLAINRPVGEMPAAKLLADLGIERPDAQGVIRIHYGGPVESKTGFILHSTDHVGDRTLVVGGKVALTTEATLLGEIGAGAGPRQSLFVLGYAGWGPNQLEGELEEGVWFTAPADAKLIFDPDHRSKWKRALARRTIDL